MRRVRGLIRRFGEDPGGCCAGCGGARERVPNAQERGSPARGAAGTHQVTATRLTVPHVERLPVRAAVVEDCRLWLHSIPISLLDAEVHLGRLANRTMLLCSMMRAMGRVGTCFL